MHPPLHFPTHTDTRSIPFGTLSLPLTVSPPVHTIRSFCKIKVVSQYQLSEGILDFLPLSLRLQLPCTHTHTHRHVRTTTTNTCTCVASSLPSVSYWAHALSLSLSVRLLLFSSPRLIQARCAHSVLRVPSPALSLSLSCLFSFYLQLVPGAHSRLEQVALPLNCNKTTTTATTTSKKCCMPFWFALSHVLCVFCKLFRF